MKKFLFFVLMAFVAPLAMFAQTTCDIPTNVNVVAGVATWEGTAPSYKVVINKGETTIADTTVVESTYTIEGLQVGDTATIAVKSLCNESESSEFTEAFEFVYDTVAPEIPVATCNVPANVALNNGTLTWESEAASFNVRIVAEITVIDTTTTIPTDPEDTTTTTPTTLREVNTIDTTFEVAGNSYIINIEGIAENDSITVFVQAVCDTNMTSEWSEAAGFIYTPYVEPVEPCNVPTNVTMTNGTLAWEGTAANYNVRIVYEFVTEPVVDTTAIDTTTTPTLPDDSITTPSDSVPTTLRAENSIDTTFEVAGNSYIINIDGLEEGDSITVYVQAICDTDMTSDWTEAAGFIYTPYVEPVEPCAVPTNVAVSATGVVTWTGTADNYNLHITIGEETIDTTVAGTTYTIEGLENGDQGTVSVQAVCDTDNISEMSEPVAFTIVIDGISNNSISANIFPNPTTGNVTIESNAINADITVFDMFGKLMMTSKVAAERTELNFSSFAPGIYMVRIAAATGTTTVKVVKE